MFTTLLGTLTSFLPKSFIFGSFVPVVIFGFLNGALLFCSSAAFRDFAGPSFAAAPVLTTAVLFVAAVVIAYIISSLQNVMRRTLEGAYTPRWLASDARNAESQRKKRLNDERDASRSDREAAADPEDLIAGLKAARDAEGPRQPGNYAGDKDADGKLVNGALRKQIAALSEQMRGWGPVSAAELSAAVTELSTALGRYPEGNNEALADDFSSLADVITYASQEAPQRERACFARRESEFGDDLPASTELGNIALGLASYTLKRYNFDIDTFWSRLQLVIQQKDPGSYGALLDVKAQLDFLIACWWFTVATTVVWVPLFAFAGDSPVAAALVAPLGVALAAAVYRLAVTAYASYTDFVRACVDLNRFALLRAMHVALPSGIREERALWNALSRVSSFGSRVVEITYQHDTGPAS